MQYDYLSIIWLLDFLKIIIMVINYFKRFTGGYSFISHNSCYLLEPCRRSVTFGVHLVNKLDSVVSNDVEDSSFEHLWKFSLRFRISDTYEGILDVRMVWNCVNYSWYEFTILNAVFFFYFWRYCWINQGKHITVIKNNISLQVFLVPIRWYRFKIQYNQSSWSKSWFVEIYYVNILSNKIVPKYTILIKVKFESIVWPQPYFSTKNDSNRHVFLNLSVSSKTL